MSQHEDHSRLFTLVAGALMLLTALTVGLSFVPFPSHTLNIVVGLIVAIAKASLVVLIFMHLKWEKRAWLAMVLFPVLLIMIIIASNLPDTGMSEQHLNRAVYSIPHAGKTGPAKH